ncbi:phenylacetate--CoA ligase family protein [Candidatus Woesearchaeota archaeon]|nr:phenylacetate--CoA ligase family protein [Candidatus Woesearchaeota archaeon]
MSLVNKFRHLHLARQRQWWPREKLLAYQEKRLRAIVAFAYHNVKFYHKQFRKAGVLPKDIRTVDDLQKLPLTTKEDMRNAFPDEIVSKGTDLSKCIVSPTSGSTGIPLKIAYDERADDFSKAINLRSYIANGLRFHDRWLTFGDPIHVHDKKFLFQKMGFLNPNYVDAFKPISQVLPQIAAVRPRVLDGYSSSIKALAYELRKKRHPKIRPEVVFGTGELLDSKTRELVEEAFGVKMIDLFGCLEMNRTAWECSRHEGYHMDVDSVVMEFLDTDGRPVKYGEKGEIVYTNLFNYAMPFIRYKIGDIGIPSKHVCSCGRGLPMMELVEGRTDDFVVDKKGGYHSPMIWTVVFKRTPQVAHYQVIQDTKGALDISVIPGDDYDDAVEKDLRKRIQETVGKDFTFTIAKVKEFKRSRSGKVRAVISKVKSI